MITQRAESGSSALGLTRLREPGLEVSVSSRSPASARSAWRRSRGSRNRARRRGLDDAPHRLAEVGHEPHQPQVAIRPSSPARRSRPRAAPARMPPELVVDREVGEVEVAVAHPRVLPVDDPEPVLATEEVRGEQVVVAGHGSLGPEGASISRPARGPARTRRDVAAALARGLGVGLDDAERVEAGGQPLSGVVDRAQRARDALIVSGSRSSSEVISRPSTNSVTRRAGRRGMATAGATPMAAARSLASRSASRRSISSRTCPCPAPGSRSRARRTSCGSSGW